MIDRQTHNNELFSHSAPLYTVVGLRTDEQRLVTDFFPPPPARVLIIGCGAGRTVIPLLEQGYTVTGVDIAEAMIGAGKKQLADRGLTAPLLTANATQIQHLFSPHTFDVIWFPFHALDYVAPLADRLDVVRQSCLLLKKEGLFVFNTHNRLFPRTFRQALLHHEAGYTPLRSKEGSLWTSVSYPWQMADAVSPLFSSINIKPRYALIAPARTMHWRERLARLTARWLDKSFYVIARLPKDVAKPGSVTS